VSRLREKLVEEALPEHERTVNALCDIRQMHLREFTDS